MRILLISGEFPPMQGGVGDYTHEMAREFVEQGHQAWVLVPEALQHAYRDQQNLPWHVLPVVTGWTWCCWQQVINVIRQIKPDLVDIQYQAAAYHMRSPAINLLPWRLRRWRQRQAGCPVIVVTFHDLQTPYLFPKAGPIRAWAVQMLARHSDAAIVTNTEDMATARSWSFFQSPTHPFLHQIPIGSNIAVHPPNGFQRDAWRARHGYGEGDFVWAYFGFLNESKGGEDLIRALALADERASLLMIGGQVGSSDLTNQDYARHIEALIDELGLQNRVRRTGYIPTAEVSAALLSTDIVVLPYRDGISFRRGSLHAALAHGCAIVSTWPRVHLSELHDGANMLLVPAGDPQALSLAAQRLQIDPSLRHEIGQGAKTLAQQFTWTQIARRTVKKVFIPLCQTKA